MSSFSSVLVLLLAACLTACSAPVQMNKHGVAATEEEVQRICRQGLASCKIHSASGLAEALARVDDEHASANALHKDAIERLASTRIATGWTYFVRAIPLKTRYLNQIGDSATVATDACDSGCVEIVLHPNPQDFGRGSRFPLLPGYRTGDSDHASPSISFLGRSVKVTALIVGKEIAAPHIVCYIGDAPSADSQYIRAQLGACWTATRGIVCGFSCLSSNFDREYILREVW
jgi:hypothetical protein